MEYIDLKFKDAHPADTVERIRQLLHDIGIEITESWHDSGIENCQSLTLYTNGIRMFSSNGKGISPEFARASAYGEFIERLQCGMQRHKYQAYERDPEIYLHAFAPDLHYKTLEEVEAEGEWMEPLIRAHPFLTRKRIAKFCKGCEFSNPEKIMTVPFYSLFEDKYVDIPVAYMEIMYTANGCCAGNSREEAWLHAISEIFERHCHIRLLKEQKAMPKFSEEFLRSFPTIRKIMDAVTESGDFILDVLDLSGEYHYPVVAARLIDKRTHGYVNLVGADPVVEIAIERALTEMFQGRSLSNLVYNSEFLEETQSSLDFNIINQLNVGMGQYSLDYFTEELSCTKEASVFPDNSNRTNRELLLDALETLRKLGLQVYVRNFSYLGFDCYKFVIPGFSETRAQMFYSMVPHHFMGYTAAKTIRDIGKATDADLQFLMSYYSKIQPLQRNRRSLQEMAGMSFNKNLDSFLLFTSLAYACYRLGRIDESISYLRRLQAPNATDESRQQYCHCVARYLTLKKTGAAEEVIRAALDKFYHKQYTEKLFRLLDQGGTPFDEDLLSCDHKRCAQCSYRNECTYDEAKSVLRLVGQTYTKFTDGQNRENFKI